MRCGSRSKEWLGLISDAIKVARPDDAPFPAGLLSDLAPAKDEAPAENLVVGETSSDETVAEAPAAAEVEKE